LVHVRNNSNRKSAGESGEDRFGEMIRIVERGTGREELIEEEKENHNANKGYQPLVFLA